MSEYQYYEWQTVDRILTTDEQTAVSRLSSHIEVSSSRALVTYSWSDFRHDPKQVLLKYFDAFFYFANWGSLCLMFRFPRGLIDEAIIEPYCTNEYISFETMGEYQVLDLDFHIDDSSWLETEGTLSDFIRLRADILDGDYRLLYLAWLKAMTLYGIPDFSDDEDDPDSPAYDREPPVPAGLKLLSPALQNFVHIFGLDRFLVQAAAETSPEPKKPTVVDYGSLVSRLPRAECDDFLTRLAEGEAGAGLALRKRLAAFLPPVERPQAVEPRTIQQLIQGSIQLKQAEKERQVEAARQKHIAEMKALATREEQTWKKVDDLLNNGRKIAAVYDEATELLDKLQQLSEFQDTADTSIRRDIFQQRLRMLAVKYSARPSLIRRWENKGWI